MEKESKSRAWAKGEEAWFFAKNEKARAQLRNSVEWGPEWFKALGASGLALFALGLAHGAGVGSMDMLSHWEKTALMLGFFTALMWPMMAVLLWGPLGRKERFAEIIKKTEKKDWMCLSLEEEANLGKHGKTVWAQVKEKFFGEEARVLSEQADLLAQMHPAPNGARGSAGKRI